MRYMNEDQHFRVVSVAAWCAWHALEDSRRFGEAVRTAIEKSDCTVAVFASGSLSHRFNDNGSPEESIHRISREFYRQVDLRVVDLWKAGDFKTFCAMLPEYAHHCHGEGGMHDTAMLLGMLGWDAYDKPGGNPDRLLRELRHRADQCGLSAVVDSRVPSTLRLRRDAQHERRDSMPHLIVEYTSNLKAEGDIPGLLRKANACSSTREACSRSVPSAREQSS